MTRHASSALLTAMFTSEGLPAAAQAWPAAGTTPAQSRANAADLLPVHLD